KPPRPRPPRLPPPPPPPRPTRPPRPPPPMRPWLRQPPRPIRMRRPPRPPPLRPPTPPPPRPPTRRRPTRRRRTEPRFASFTRDETAGPCPAVFFERRSGRRSSCASARRQRASAVRRLSAAQNPAVTSARWLTLAPSEEAAMSVIQSQIDTRGPEYAANAEQLAALVKDLKAELARAAQGGGEKARQKHTERGKLLPRER